ncbi:MAG: NUDIX domain-containing protein [Deltaproteobacteria bacterium]|nr:NUDIX domain-containing protein [Deltaproteobacteria bacterium]
MDADNLSEEIALYNIDGKQIGKIDRHTAHKSKEYLHGAVHIFVFNSDGKILLQKRAKNKIIAPGKYDISAGGHINFGEDELSAARRELEEELRIKNVEIKFLYKYIWESEIEREFVFSFYTLWDGEITYQKDEIEEVSCFNISDITESDIFSSNLIYEIKILRKYYSKLF